MPVSFSSDLLDFEGTAEVRGLTADVGEGGLFIKSDLLEPVGTPVRVRLLPGDGTPINLEGAVAWVAEEPPKGPGMGIALSGSDRSYFQFVATVAARAA